MLGKVEPAMKSDVKEESRREAALGELSGLLDPQIRTGFVE